MNRRKPLRRALSALMALALAACDMGDPAGPAPDPGGNPATGNLRFTIKHVVSDALSGSTPLAFGGAQYQTDFGNTYTVSRLRYYISQCGVKVGNSGVDFDITHLVDTDDPATLRFFALDVPADHYDDIVFTIGLPADENVTGMLTGPEHDDMAWPANLGGGYYYMKLEGDVFDSGGQPQPFLTGTGRVDSGGGPQHHFVAVILTPHFNVIPGKTVDVELIMDVNEWYRTPNTIDLETHVGGIDADDAMQTLLEENGANAFRVGTIKTL
jgi:hypothetical protein